MSRNNKSLLLMISFIPAMFVMLFIGISLKLFIEQSALYFYFLLFVIYLLPPLMWRILAPLIPPKMGMSYLSNNTEEVNGWFVSYQIQRIYNALPFIESTLKIIPGVYSQWLRLWGAKIGCGVDWSLQSRVIDRPFIHVGDRSSIGNDTYLSAHTIKKNEHRYHLYISEIFIGSDVIVSLKSVIGPGVHIGNNAYIRAQSSLLANMNISEGQIF